MIVNLSKLPTFADGEIFHVVVESPRGAKVKLKFDEALNAMAISRPLALGLTYPFDWGFIPSTHAADGDPVDAVVLWDVATFPGVVIRCRALAVLQIEQRGSESPRIRNDRVIALPVEARRETALTDDGQLSPRVQTELVQFLLASTALENKDARFMGWGGAEAALAVIRTSSR